MIEDALKQVLKNKFSNNELEKEKLIKVLFLAQRHLNTHQLQSTEVKYIKSIRAMGKCYNNGESIGLSICHTLNNSMELIEEVILHEIAHALVGNDFGHGVEWQSKAIELGLSIEHIKNYKIQ